MSQEYLTRYPKTLFFCDGKKHTISVDPKGVEQLSVIVRKSAEEILHILKKEGFTKVKFEHKQDSQIGHGLSLKLKKPWEMHLRLFDLKKDFVAIQAEVEVSRDYLQHLFCQRTPVIYEIEALLKKHQIEYQIWSDKVKNYVHTVFDNYKIKLTTPSIPVFAWKPMLFVISTVGIFYLWKYLNTI
jgi:ribosomal protein S8